MLCIRFNDLIPKFFSGLLTYQTIHTAVCVWGSLSHIQILYCLALSFLSSNEEHAASFIPVMTLQMLVPLCKCPCPCFPAWKTPLFPISRIWPHLWVCKVFVCVFVFVFFWCCPLSTQSEEGISIHGSELVLEPFSFLCMTSWSSCLLQVYVPKTLGCWVPRTAQRTKTRGSLVHVEESRHKATYLKLTPFLLWCEINLVLVVFATFPAVGPKRRHSVHFYLFSYFWMPNQPTL